MRLTAATVRTLVLPEGKSDAITFDDDLPGFGVRMRAGGSAVFVFQYKLGTKQRRLTLGTVKALDLAKARATAKDLVAKVRLGGDPAGDKALARIRVGETFAAITVQYLAYKSREMRARSHDQIVRHLNVDAKPLHQLQLEKISRRDIASCVSAIRTGGAPIAANRVRSTLSAFFAWCLAEGLVENNPTIGTKPGKEVSRERVLDDSELRVIWNALPDDEFGGILKLLMLTGQRSGELGGLRWSEIDDVSIRLPGERTKNKRAHIIPLSQPVRAILAAQHRHAGRDLIFGRGAAGFNSWSARKEVLDLRIAEINGRALPPWRIHDLRRSFATHAAELGIQPHIVEQILNHVGGHKAGVAGTYNRAVYAAEVKTALDRWAAHLIDVVEGSASKITPMRRGA
jgi:integrase